GWPDRGHGRAARAGRCRPATPSQSCVLSRRAPRPARCGFYHIPTGSPRAPFPDRPMRVFAYEHLCAGGLAGAPGGEALFAEGWAMPAAALSDLAVCAGVRPVTLVRPDLLQLVQAVAPDAETHPATGADEAQFRELARSATFSLVVAPEFDDLLARRCEWAL